MNIAIVKTLVAGKRISTESDSPRELIPTLVERSCLDEDEFDFRGYVRHLEKTLNDPETSDKEYLWTLNRIEFLGGSISWESQYLDGTGDVSAIVTL